MAEDGRNLILQEKPVKILCYGNNDFKSSELQIYFSEERVGELPFRISLHYAPDLDLLNSFTKPVYTDEIAQLIGEGDQTGRGVDVFLILISLSTVSSKTMYDLLASIPDILELKEENRQHFWDRAVIAFDATDHLNAEAEIQKSIRGNVGIKRMVDKAGGRYTYVSRVEPNAFMDGLVKQYQILTTKRTDRYTAMRRYLAAWWTKLKQFIAKIQNEPSQAGLDWGQAQDRTGNREFIGGPVESYLMKIGNIKPLNDSNRGITMSIFKNILKKILFVVMIIILTLLLIVLLVVFFPVTILVGITLLCVLCVTFVVKNRGFIRRQHALFLV